MTALVLHIKANISQFVQTGFVPEANNAYR